MLIAFALSATAVAQYDTLQYHARVAKEKGQRTLALTQFEVYAFPKTLDLLLSGSSAFLISVDRLKVAQAHSRMTIQTWHTFNVHETLSMRAGPADLCEGVRSPVALRGSKVALAISGGSVTVDDVLVTAPSSWRVGPVLNQRYLVFGTRCYSGVLSLHHGLADLFTVDSTGALSFAAGDVAPDTGHYAVVHSVRSLTNLRARLTEGGGWSREVERRHEGPPRADAEGGSATI